MVFVRILCKQLEIAAYSNKESSTNTKYQRNIVKVNNLSEESVKNMCQKKIQIQFEFNFQNDPITFCFGLKDINNYF